MLKFNEAQACEAIVRHLEARCTATRADVQWPEKVSHADPVEMTWRFGSRLFAIEHTGIEPFDNHIRLEANSEWLFDPICSALGDLLPLEYLAHPDWKLDAARSGR